MLSKVAERIYWIGRYLERTENTARLISVYANLLLDLPREVNLGWYNLVVLNSVEEAFNERYKIQDERNVVKFLVNDEKNPISIQSSLKSVRENVRTTRDVVPAETWELINELFIFVSDNVQKFTGRGQRNIFLEGVIRGCQQLNGLLYGTMTHDAAGDFLRLGRNLERADMTTRLLDAGLTAVAQTEEDDAAVNAQQIIWGSVLRSVGGDQSYRRKTRSAIHGEAVMNYLLEDSQFPRTIQHCLSALVDSGSKLPRNEPVIKDFNIALKRVFKRVPYDASHEDMRTYLNDLQITLANLHGVIACNWFNASAN